MPSAIAAARPPATLQDAIARMDGTVLDAERRAELLARSFELRSGREKPGRFWKIDLDALSFDTLEVPASVAPTITAPQARGLIACDLASAARLHGDLLARAFGKAVVADTSKFAALTSALCNTGAFVYVPADVAVDEPIEIVYDAQAALFPYTVILAEHGASVSIIERLRGAANAFVCGVDEIVASENAQVTFAVEQDLPADARVVFTRVAKPAKDATVVWSVADIGASLTVGSIDVIVDHPGVDAQINGLFFPRDDQHVDLVSTVEHNVGESQSETVIKSAATGSRSSAISGKHSHRSARARHRVLTSRRCALALRAFSHRFGTGSGNRCKRREGVSRCNRRRARRRTDLLYDQPRHLTRRRGTDDCARLFRAGDRAVSHQRLARTSAQRAPSEGIVVLRPLTGDPKLERIIADFPILRQHNSRGKRLVFLDSAATSQKPQAVIDSLVDYYSHYNANIHRGVYEIAALATEAFEAARGKVAGFVNAQPQEIIWTRNTTEAINLVSYSWGLNNLREGDAILTTQLEHHSNLVPWQLLAEKTGARLRFIPVDDRGLHILDDLDTLLEGCKLVALSHVSNTLGHDRAAGDHYPEGTCRRRTRAG